VGLSRVKSIARLSAIADLKSAIERIVPQDIQYSHDQRWGDGNGFAHVRAALLGPSLAVPFAGGKLRLGTWQQIILVDFDNRPRTREVKLGCVFTQTACDDQERPMRDEASTTYVGAIEEAETFGRRLYTEAWQRGWSRALLKVILGDGAAWIWNIADQHFPGAIQIVDLYHAREHIWELAAKLFPSDEKQRKGWAKKMIKHLDCGRIEALVAALRAFPTSNVDLLDNLRTEADYFQRNRERMRYPRFRKLGLFVGSGVIEAGCKTVIGARLKQSGMFWTVRGANAIIAVRCNRISGTFEDYWENRVA
jgi:hypothetical protein